MFFKAKTMVSSKSNTSFFLPLYNNTISLYIYPHRPSHFINSKHTSFSNTPTQTLTTSLSISLTLSMGAPHLFSSLSCELRIIQAKNVESKSKGSFFVRYYLSAGNNQTIQLNTREISFKSDLSWNESFSLECHGSQDSMDNLKQQNVVFELRWRDKVPVLGKIGGSQLLGRAEIPWKQVFESPNMEIEKWVTMVSTKGHVLPKLQVGMRIQVPAMVEVERRTRGKVNKWDDQCGCKDGHCYSSCGDYEIFALAAVLEAF